MFKYLYLVYQISQVEEELNKEWKEKCDRLLNAANEKHNRALLAMREEKEELEEKLSVLQNKVCNYRFHILCMYFTLRFNPFASKRKNIKSEF